MKPFSKVYARIGTESAFAVGPEIAGFIKQGYDIVKVNVGEPGCNIPEASTKSAIESFQKHETHYMDSRGVESLREKTAAYMAATRGVPYTKDDLIFSPGGKPVIGGAVFIFAQPGDEVIYPTPGYPIYESMIDLVGAKAVPIAIREDKGFRFDIADLKKLVSKKTKLLILNSPSNPTGGVLQEEDLAEIAKLAKKFDFYILSDECYSRIAFEGNKIRTYKGNKLPVCPSIASYPGMAERTVVLDAFSKTYAMTGLRVGYSTTKNKEFTAKFLTFAINFWSSIPAPCMVAAEAALGKDQREAQAEVEKYREKRDVVVSALNKIEGIKCLSIKGSFYLFPNVTLACKKLGLKDSEGMRKYLLTYDKKNKKGVAVLARKHFGRRLKSEKEEYIRISIAGTMESLKEGVPSQYKKEVEKYFRGLTE